MSASTSLEKSTSTRSYLNPRNSPASETSSKSGIYAGRSLVGSGLKPAIVNDRFKRLQFVYLSETLFWQVNTGKS